MTYDPATNSRASYALALRACREIGIRRGTITPTTDTERQWACEGDCGVQKLETARG